MVQGIVYDNDIEGEGAVGGTMEIPTELEDTHPHFPENMVQDIGSASPSQSGNDEIMAPMELGLETMGKKMDSGQVEAKAMGDGLRCDMEAMGRKMDAGQAKFKAMGDDVALKFQAVWDEVNGVRGCVDGVWEEMKVGQVKMTDKIQTEIKGLKEGQEQLRI